MLKNGSPGRRYSWGGAVALFIAILVCIGLLLYGPVDLAIASGSGIDISQSPAAFLVTQMLLTILAYGCIAGLSIWITTYIKLRKDIK